MRESQRSIAQSILIELQTREARRITPQAGCDKVQHVFEVAILRLKVMRTKIHPFRPDWFCKSPHEAPPVCGSRMINSICGLEISAGTRAAKFRARTTV